MKYRKVYKCVIVHLFGEFPSNMSEPHNDQRGISRRAYELSLLVADIKQGLLNETSPDAIASSLLEKYPVTRIASDLTHAVDMVGGLEARLNKAEIESTTDALTGVLNRRSLDDQLPRELKWISEKPPRKGENSGRLSYILLDIDHFKQINDEYGHGAGDFVLKEIGTLLKTVPNDESIPNVIKSRLGGEEFVLIARNYAELPAHIALRPDSNKIITGFDIAEILRSEIEHYPFMYREGNREVRIPVTASFGVAGYDFGGYKYLPHGESIPEIKKMDDEKDLYKRADDALYHSKKHGRNQTTVYRDAKSEIPIKKAESGFKERVKAAYDVLRGRRQVR